MMLQEPATSDYDLQFNVFGFATRITWGFWIAAAVLGWNWAMVIDQGFASVDRDSPGAPMLLVIWAGALLLSILVHELGHAFAMRYYGIDSRIVLYHFGGLAIPASFGAWNAARRRHQLAPLQSLIVSAAGPAAQLLLAAVVYAAGRALSMRLSLDDMLMDYFGITPPDTPVPSSAAAYAIFNALIEPSVFWAIFNLLPIIPMDGGNIMRELLVLNRNRDPYRNAHWVSIIVAVLVGIYFMQTGNPMMGLMCLMFAASNWQQMQFMSGSF